MSYVGQVANPRAGARARRAGHSPASTGAGHCFRARGDERGFALLLVFLMAAVIGITLYAELPRVALQSQRAKEQLLMERGEQFKRAIQLYFRASKGTKYPADIDDLDRGFNNLRFLRHRYKDPMTGKDEWRIIHIQGGVLTDSLLTKPKDSSQQEESTLGQNISARAGLGEPANAGQPAPNAVNRRRQSEGGSGGGVGPDGQPIQPTDSSNGAQPGAGVSAGDLQPGAPGGPQQAGAGLTPGTFQPGVFPGGVQQPPSGMPGIPGQPGMPGMPFGAPGSAGNPGFPGFPGQLPGQPVTTGQPAFPGSNPGTNTGASGQGGNAGDSGSSVGSYGSTVGYSSPPTGTAGQYGTPGSQYGAASSQSGPNAPNGPNAANTQNGMPGAGLAPNSAAAGMLNNLLMGPRPGGSPVSQTGTTVGGGMAGVASKMDADGIMEYNDRTNYKEWEFIYDPTKDRPRQDPRNMLVGSQAGTPAGSGQNATTPTSQSGTFGSSTFGSGQSSTPGQSGQSAACAQGASSSAPGGQTGACNQAGGASNTGTGQGGGSVDIRPGKK